VRGADDAVSGGLSGEAAAESEPAGSSGCESVTTSDSFLGFAKETRDGITIA
jgi:hypothetical protein